MSAIPNSIGLRRDDGLPALVTVSSQADLHESRGRDVRAIKDQKNVLLVLGWYDHRLLRGISMYASEHGWHLSSHSIIHERVIPWGWQGDGILAWLDGGNDLADFVLSRQKPTVDFSLRQPQLAFARVLQDHAKAGHLAAEHFLDHGLRSFLFYTNSENCSHHQRGLGFAKTLAQFGHKCEILRWHGSDTYATGATDWCQRREWLLEHLKRVPKPAGIFAANGSLAVEVQELCTAANMAVPSEIAIVGVEDYLLCVGGDDRAISGVNTNFEEQGYQGAALLDRLMHGEPPPKEPMLISPVCVTARKSSDIMAVDHPSLARGLRFIADHFTTPLSVDDVARAAGMSRRALHQAFCRHIVCTPGETIRRMRINFAKRRLAESNDKIETIAVQTGFSSLNTFFIAFRKSEKMTPTEFRKFARLAR
jgi:LacI family transcriptional regulator